MYIQPHDDQAGYKRHIAKKTKKKNIKKNGIGVSRVELFCFCLKYFVDIKFACLQVLLATTQQQKITGIFIFIAVFISV
jgi:hypothetical protein